MFWIFILILILTTYLSYLYYIYNIKLNHKTNSGYSFSGQKNKYLLTKIELSFFYKLKNITDKYELYIFPKIRLADIINADNFADFNKIKAKHIDFTICDKYCSPILFIELDDKSHHTISHKENDIRKDYILECVNGNLIRVTPAEIEYKLKYIEDCICNKDKRYKH